MLSVDSSQAKAHRLQLLHKLGPHGDDLGTGEAPVRVEENEVRLLVPVGHQSVCISLVGDRLLVEDVFSVAALLELIEVVAKEIPEMVKRIPKSVILTVVMLLVEVRRILGHPMIVIVPPPLGIREKFVGSCDEDKLVLRIRCLVLVRVGFLDETSVGFFSPPAGLRPS